MIKIPSIKLLIPLIIFSIVFLHSILTFSSTKYALTTSNLKQHLLPSSRPQTWFKGERKELGFQPSLSTLEPISFNSTVRVRGGFVILCKNEDLFGIIDSIRSLEDRFNKNFNYPYIFLSDTPFTPTFKSKVNALVPGSKTSFGLIPNEHWGDGLPEWINTKKMEENMVDMTQKSVPYAGSISYRKMCRFQSGFFWRHELLDDLDYYWRVEPNVKFFCDIKYDPFLYMQDNYKKYGFVISIKEYEATIPSLWAETKKFILQNSQYLAYPNSMDFISSDGGETYNLCHFWSNFEIASLSLWRSEAYQKYFEHLDQSGGFFEERWGDAPVHSKAAALFLKPEEIHFFQDIGYRHEPFQQCPADKATECACNPEDSFESHWYSCTSAWKKFRTWGS